MDEKTKAEWEKSKRIEAEKMKAMRDLNARNERLNTAYLDPTKAHGFSRDPNTIMKNAERMANISIIFAPVGVLFGILSLIFDIVAFANKLGLAGAGISILLNIVQYVGIGVGVLAGLVSLGCTIVFARRSKYDVKYILITSICALSLIAVYYIALYFINRA